MKTKALLAVLLSIGAPLHGAEGAVDVSGVYADRGMTIRADAGAPGADVSLCLLLSAVIDPAQHATMAGWGLRAQVTQQEDLVLKFDGGGVREKGSYRFLWTKADGMKVDAEGVTFSRALRARSETATASYHLTLDRERRLVVTAEFVIHARGILGPKAGPRVTGVYVFPRMEGMPASVDSASVKTIRR